VSHRLTAQPNKAHSTVVQARGDNTLTLSEAIEEANRACDNHLQLLRLCKRAAVPVPVTTKDRRDVVIDEELDEPRADVLGQVELVIFLVLQVVKRCNVSKHENMFR